MNMNEIKMACPCCGKTSVADYEVCDNCNWENDPIQRKHPDLAGGANKQSLKQAKATK